MSSAGQGIPPFAGGLPTSRDLAPTIVFLILYGLSIPLLVYRLVKHFNKLLIRPAIFCAVRLGAFGLRAYMAKAFPNYILSEVIAEIILISIGYLFLCDSLVALWQANVETHSPLSVQPSWIQKIARILRLLLLVTIILTIVSANLNSSYESNNSTGANIRHASYCLSFAVAAVTLLAVTLTYFELNLDFRRTAYILIPAISLIIAGIYRVVNSFSTNEADAIRNLASFWCMQALFEFVAYMSFLAISVPEQYPAAVHERERGDSRTSDNTMVPIDNPRRQPKQAQSPPV